MSDRRKIEVQKKLISRQAEQIELLKSENERLQSECLKKDEEIKCMSSLKEEMKKDVSDIKRYKNEYKKLIDELKKMKSVMNQTVYNGRWWLVKFLIK